MTTSSFRKIFLFSVLFLILLITVSCNGFKEESDLDTGKAETGLNQTELKDSTYTEDSVDYSDAEDSINYSVDKQINEITESDAYKTSSIDERKEMISKLLTRLEEENAISYFSYSEESCMFSFEYKDGVLGGVLIKDFNTQFN